MMPNIACKRVDSWDEFLNYRSNFEKSEWVFRGQCAPDLKTSLERACEMFNLKLRRASHVEENLIREFRRKYDGREEALVKNDTLYCLSLMQHHGAPTRLLDWTYSPFVAVYFALEYFRDKKVIRKKQEEMEYPEIWCINMKWCQEMVYMIDKIGSVLESSRYDENASDDNFRNCYIKNARDFVCSENPFFLHQRLTVQQGVFLCPGNISKPFMDNLKALRGWNKKENVLKITFRFNQREFRKAVDDLYRMNVSRASLFPGLDGFAGSLKFRIPFLNELELFG